MAKDQAHKADTETPKQSLMADNPQDINFEGFSTVDGVRQEAKPADAKSEPAPTPAPAPDDKADPTPTAPAPADGEEGEVIDDNDPQDSPKSRSAQARINQAIARQRAAERQAAMLEGKISAIQARLDAQDKPANDPKTDPTAPKPEAYEYGELDPKFIGDLARHEARAEFAAQQAEADKKRDERDASERAAKANQQVAEFSTKWTDKYSDFNAVVIQSAENNEWPLSQTLGMLAINSPVGGDVLYSLAKDVNEAQRVAALPDLQQAAWFGEQAARFSPTTPGATPTTPSTGEQGQRVTSAPAPLQYESKGVGSSSIASDTTNFADFEKIALANK